MRTALLVVATAVWCVLAAVPQSKPEQAAMKREVQFVKSEFTTFYSQLKCPNKIKHNAQLEQKLLENCRGLSCVCGSAASCRHVTFDLADEVWKNLNLFDEQPALGQKISRAFTTSRREVFRENDDDARAAFGNNLIERWIPAYHLAKRDERRRRNGASVEDAAPLNEHDHEAFRCIYDGTGGPYWTVCKRHGSDNPCACSNVICETVGDERRIVGLVLPRANLTNFMPSCVTNLAKLRVLDVSLNGIKGHWPVGIEKLTELEMLSMPPSSSLMPPAFASLKNLRFLELSYATRELAPFHVIRPICELKQLRVLMLNMGYVGELPECIGALTSLVRLEVSGNHLMNTAIPSAWGALESLRVFVAFQQGRVPCPPKDPKVFCRPLYQSVAEYATEHPWICRQYSLSGPIPESLRNWHRIEKFWVDGTFLSGSIPDWIGTDWPKLRSLDLFNNDLHGPIPDSLGQLTRLEHLQLQNNDLTGDVPPSLARLPRLALLNVALNRALTGCVRPNAFPTYLTLHDDHLPECATTDSPTDGLREEKDFVDEL